MDDVVQGWLSLVDTCTNGQLDLVDTFSVPHVLARIFFQTGLYVYRLADLFFKTY